MNEANLFFGELSTHSSGIFKRRVAMKPVPRRHVAQVQKKAGSAVWRGREEEGGFMVSLLVPQWQDRVISGIVGVIE